jgi:hypothetical protein
VTPEGVNLQAVPESSSSTQDETCLVDAFCRPEALVGGDPGDFVGGWEGHGPAVSEEGVLGLCSKVFLEMPCRDNERHRPMPAAGFPGAREAATSRGSLPVAGCWDAR